MDSEHVKVSNILRDQYTHVVDHGIAEGLTPDSQSPIDPTNSNRVQHNVRLAAAVCVEFTHDVLMPHAHLEPITASCSRLVL
jgi:hypothetical protein